MNSIVSTIGVVSYGLCLAAFLTLTAPVIVRWRGQIQGGLLGLACAATSFWSAVIAYRYATGADPGGIEAVAEAIRNVAWVMFLWSTLMPEDGAARRPWRGAFLSSALVVALVLVIAVEVGAPRLSQSWGGQLPAYLRVLLAVAGLVLTESLYRNTRPDARWGIKFLCLATGTMFVYDLLLFADAILFRQTSETLFLARGAVNVMVAPLLAVAIARSRVWRVDIHVSRQVALHSTALIAGGAYLSLMAAGGFYVRQIGGGSGAVLQIVYSFGAIILLALILFSGAARAFAKDFISKHFYSHKYDYRAEWLKFVRSLSAEHRIAPLEERVIRAIADIVESPGGALLLIDGHRYAVAASWNMGSPAASLPRSASFERFLDAKQWVVDVEEAASRPGRYNGPAVPPELGALRKAWLVVPLWHHGLIGMVVLARARAPRKLGREDYDLLKTVGRQAASYLAEQRASQALGEAREFEIFNHRFAFVLHDIKNLVSQLSLGVTNLDKHGDNKAFREDMTRTVTDATEKMKRLIDRINAFGGAEDWSRGVNIRQLVDDLVSGRKSGAAPVEFDSDDADIVVPGDRDRISSVFDHLLQNAIDAAGSAGRVNVSLRAEDDSVVLEVTDDGPGMDRNFIRDELFRPFRTSKDGGMGIGAFQCREYVREMGGELDVVSQPGQGTTMRVTLPVEPSGRNWEQAPAPAGAP